MLLEKNSIRITLSSLFCAIIMYSCQPEHMEEPPAESGKLATYLVLDTLYPSGNDTAMKYSYTYDGEGRVTSMYLQEYDAGDIGSGVLYWQQEKHFYNGTEKTPWKIVTISSEFATPQFYDTAFIYYSNGLVSTDSSVLYNPGVMLSKNVRQYSSPGANWNKVVNKTYIHSYNFSYSYSYNLTSKYNIQNGNMLEAVDTLHDYTGPEFWLYKYQFQYDNKANPLYGTTLPALNPIFFNIYTDHIFRERQNVNNIVVKQYDEDDPNRGHFKGTEIRKYTYDANGKVLSYTIEGTTEKHIFLYK